MAQKTKIRKDELGLYTVAGGYLIRPFHGTIFEEGDEVKTHHFGGSTNAGVTFNKPEFSFRIRTNSQFEFWTTTGLGNKAYEIKNFVPNKYKHLFNNKSYNTFEEYLKLNTDWYRDNNFNPIGKIHNNGFAEKNKNQK